MMPRAASNSHHSEAKREAEIQPHGMADDLGREFANRIRRRAPRRGDKWHLDEVVVSIAGKKHWLWRAVDQDGFVLDV